MFANPAIFLAMIRTAQDLDLQVTTLQAASIGGAPCSREVALQIKQALNIRRLFVSKLAAMCLYENIWVVSAIVFSPYCLVLLRNRRTCEIMFKILWKMY